MPAAEIWFHVAREEPVLDSGRQPIGRLRPGQRYRALSIADGWVSVPGPDGTQGFVPAASVELEETPVDETARVEGSVPRPPTVQTGPASQSTVNTPTPVLERGRSHRTKLVLVLVGVLILAVGAGAVVLLTLDSDEVAADGIWVHQPAVVSPDLEMELLLSDAQITEGFAARGGSFCFDFTFTQADQLDTTHESGLRDGIETVERTDVSCDGSEPLSARFIATYEDGAIKGTLDVLDPDNIQTRRSFVPFHLTLLQ